MNDEAAFQDWLDAHPDDHTARMVFADWLDERDDPRGPGYRVLGVLGLVPASGDDFIADLETDSDSDKFSHWWYGLDPRQGRIPKWGGNGLPEDWLYAMPGSRYGFFPADVKPNTRHEVENCAALAFAELPVARRAELLSRTPAAATT